MTAVDDIKESEGERAARLEAATRQIRGRSRLTFRLLFLGLAYILFAWFALDISTILAKSEPEQAGVLMRDAVAHKHHVVYDYRREEFSVSVEGDSRSVYKELPHWVTRKDGVARIDLGDDVRVEMSETKVAFNWPGYGDVVAHIDGRKLTVDLPAKVLAEEQAHEELLVKKQIRRAQETKRRSADWDFEKSLEGSDWFSATAARAARWAGRMVSGPAPLSADEIAEIRSRFAKSINTPKLSFSGRSMDVRLDSGKRIRIIAGTKVEVHRFEYGWENFFFEFSSPLRALSWGELASAALSGDRRFDEAQSNAGYIFWAFWNNAEWRHGYIANAVLETLLMAFVGTFFASFFGLPLAFLAARNFAPRGWTGLLDVVAVIGAIFVFFYEMIFAGLAGPLLNAIAPGLGGVSISSIGGFLLRLVQSLFVAIIFFGAVTAVRVGFRFIFNLIGADETSENSSRLLRNFAPIRFVTRRFFDFLRGIDMLIWSLIFIRAFGLGPLTGAMAIAFTDTGTLGKLFSEALENVDKKQIEGVEATGARQLQRYRFGVIPQIMPVFISQSLYYFESNIRSATVIGALGAGGIGLVLRETINTQKDWEKVLLLIILTVLVVVIVDMISGWLRRRLIEGGVRRASMTAAIMVGLAGGATAWLFGLSFLGVYWWIFTLIFAVAFMALALVTVWLIAKSPRESAALRAAATV